MFKHYSFIEVFSVYVFEIDTKIFNLIFYNNLYTVIGFAWKYQSFNASHVCT